MSQAPVELANKPIAPFVRSTSEPRLPPEQVGWPLVGVAWHMRVDPLRFMLKAIERHGDTVRMRLAKYHATLISDPEHIRRVFVDNASNYTKKTRGYRKARIVLGDGLVTSEGPLWQRQRRIATPAFHRQRIAGFAGVMTAATERMLSDWRQRSGPAADAPLDVFRELMRLTLRIALQTLLGVGADDEIDELARAVSEVLERTNDLITNPFSPAPWLPTPKNLRLKSAIATIDRFVYATIARRRARPAAGEGAGDLLSMLMDARDEETGQGMTDRQLRDEAVTVLIAGHETTANALAWTFHLLGQHPELAQKVQKEAQAVAAGRAFTADDLPNLPYTRAVIEESMRLYPPAWMIGRAATADDVLGPYMIPGGTFVLVSPYITHRHPGLWDNPETFDPQRFLDGRAAGLPKFAYLPFGGGQRFCIGANFAMMEATLVLATMARVCRLAPVPGFQVEPFAMITLRPKSGVQMRAHWQK